MEYYRPIPTSGMTVDQQMAVHRMNCLGSLFYFVKLGLRRDKMTETLHLPMCWHFERDYLKDLYEWPRDHYKSTIASEGLPIWRVLPFTPRDEDNFLKAGYSDKYIAFMKRKHDPSKRNLLVSENITNASKLGVRISRHFESNSFFRTLFPEIIPTPQSTWNTFSLHINNPFSHLSTGGPHGEGTFDFLGVGGALQSRHYNGMMVQDDLVGRKAIQSQSIMDSTIEYHSLLAGAFEDEDPTHEADEIVIGNRWGYYDMNSWIRENEPWFRVSSHDAEGGCCQYHPAGTPIFPQVFSMDKLFRLKQRFGPYFYSCQYRNNPQAPEDADFKVEWLNYFELIPLGDETGYRIVHEITDGLVRKDMKTARLALGMACDPNHAGNAAQGRSRHAIVVWGMSEEGDFYLLEEWAKACNYDVFYDKIFEIAAKWKIRKVGFETVTAQKYAAHHIGWLNAIKPWKIKIIPLKGEVEAPDGTMTIKKEWRIRAVLSPIASSGAMWIQKKAGQILHQDFLNEYKSFGPKTSRYKDLLDASAYVPQMVKRPTNWAIHQAMLQENQRRARMVNQSYSIGVN